jgi:hypothetical protein
MGKIELVFLLAPALLALQKLKMPILAEIRTQANY